MLTDGNQVAPRHGVEEAFRKSIWNTYAPMCRITLANGTRMNGNTVHRETQHVIHVRVVEGGAMPPGPFDDREHAGRGWRIVGAVENDSGPDFVPASEDRDSLKRKVHQYPRRAGGNISIIPDEIAEAHFLADLEQALDREMVVGTPFPLRRTGVVNPLGVFLLRGSCLKNWRRNRWIVYRYGD